MSIGQERVRHKIKFEVARILQTEVNDPRMGMVTVIDVDLTPDYRYVTVSVSVLADRPAEVRKVMRMLEDARGFVQSKVAGRLRTRVTPELRWRLDTGVERSVKISSLLDDLRREREERDGPPAEAHGTEEAELEDLDAEDEDLDDEDEDLDDED